MRAVQVNWCKIALAPKVINLYYFVWVVTILVSVLAMGFCIILILVMIRICGTVKMESGLFVQKSACTLLNKYYTAHGQCTGCAESS
jgi:hypothetical protein